MSLTINILLDIEYPPRYCFGGRSRKLCADDEVNDYLNAKIKEAMDRLDEKK